MLIETRTWVSSSVYLGQINQITEWLWYAQLYANNIGVQMKHAYEHRPSDSHTLLQIMNMRAFDLNCDELELPHKKTETKCDS